MLKLLKASKLLIISLLLLTAPLNAATYHNAGANLLWDQTSIIDNSKTAHSMSVTFIPDDVTHSTSSTWGQVVAFVGQRALMSLSISTTGYPRFRWYRTSVWETVTGANALTNGTKYTLVGTWTKGGSCYIYTNGVQSSPVTASNLFLNNGGGIYFNSLGGFGNNPGTPFYGGDAYNFVGTISEACVWNDVALSAQDAINISSGIVASCRDIRPDKLTAYWPLDEYPDGTDVDGYYYASQDPIHAGGTSANMLVEGNSVIFAVAEPQLTHK